MTDPLCLELDSEVSGRTAIVSDEGDSVWLYLTHPNEAEFERDCWLFNKPSAAAEPDLDAYREANLPPPAPASLIRPEGIRSCPEDGWTARWSKDGESVVIALDGVDMGLASMSEEHGMSRYLTEACGWGTPWNEALLDRLL